MSIAKIEEILFGASTILKYVDEDKNTVLKKSGDGIHAEIHMLNQISEDAMIKLLKEGDQTTLEELVKLLKQEEVECVARATEQTEEEVMQNLPETKKSIQKQIEKMEKKGAHKDKEAIEDYKQTKEKVKILMNTLDSLKKWGRKLNEVEKKYYEEDLKKINEETRYRKQKLKQLTVKKDQDELDYFLKQTTEDNKYLHRLLDKYKYFPSQFWVSKSPCKDCGAALQMAYYDRGPATIHIASIYEGETGKKENFVKLCKKFTFETWDLEEECMRRIQVSMLLERCKKKRDKTMKEVASSL